MPWLCAMVRLQRADIKAKQHKDLSKFELSFHANKENLETYE